MTPKATFSIATLGNMILSIAAGLFMASSTLSFPIIGQYGGFIGIILAALVNQASRKISKPWIYVNLLITGSIYYGLSLSWLYNYYWPLFGLTVLLCAPFFILYFSLFNILTMPYKAHWVKGGIAVMLYLVLHTLYSFSPVGPMPLDSLYYLSGQLFPALPFISFGLVGSFFMASAVLIAEQIASKNIGRFFSLLILCFITYAVITKIPPRSSGPVQQTLKTALIQHNLPLNPPISPESRDQIFNDYGALTREAALKNPDLIIFPLYELFHNVLKDPSFFTGLARETDTHILLSAYIRDEMHDDIFIDMALLFSPDGSVNTYQSHLPPPLAHKGEIPSLRYEPMQSPWGPIGIFLCYENIYPHLAKKASQKGAGLFISMAIPGYFNESWVPHYHLLQDRLRAIQSGRYVLRLTPNTNSAVINPQGQVLQQAEIGTQQILYAEIPILKRNTFYNQSLEFYSILSFAGLSIVVMRHFIFLRKKTASG